MFRDLGEKIPVFSAVKVASFVAQCMCFVLFLTDVTAIKRIISNLQHTVFICTRV